MIKALSVAMPPKSILDPEFKYRHSWNTDIRETWRKAREEQQKKLTFVERRFNNA